ncbi:DUF4363 family protein [Oceanobacillus damuensis]|uniref:DUF4363 family protein n=1 Tax=Oceanobacillus damuensis TaxID=937928 RepID=UPI000836BEED|nr:DUF4363 family protein [Oceanobacillus damuensis]
MKKQVLTYLFLMVLLSACTNKVGGHYFFDHIDQFEKALDQPDWTYIETQAEELNFMYEDNKWKLQLIGDEGEYEGIDESINKLMAAVKEEDILNVRMELVTIKAHLEGIFSL